jgi:hypothetical protein
LGQLSTNSNPTKARNRQIADSVSIDRFYGGTMRRAQNVQFLLTPSVRRALIAADADVHNVCEAGSVTFDLTGLAEQIRMRAADWQSLSLSWTEREMPIHPVLP